MLCDHTLYTDDKLSPIGLDKDLMAYKRQFVIEIDGVNGVKLAERVYMMYAIWMTPTKSRNYS